MQTHKRVKVKYSGQNSSQNSNPQQQFYNGATTSSPSPSIAKHTSSPQKTLIMKTFTLREKQMAKRHLFIFAGGAIFGLGLGFVQGFDRAVSNAYMFGGFALIFYLTLIIVLLKITFVRVIAGVIGVVIAWAISFFVTPFIILQAIYIVRDGRLPFLLRHIAQFTHVIYEKLKTSLSNS